MNYRVIVTEIREYQHEVVVNNAANHEDACDKARDMVAAGEETAFRISAGDYTLRNVEASGIVRVPASPTDELLAALQDLVDSYPEPAGTGAEAVDHRVSLALKRARALLEGGAS